MSLVFTQLAADSFSPNANPLNPANWTTASDGFTNLQALSGFCVQTAVGGSGDLYTGVIFPNDQYAQITLNALTTTDVAIVGVRSDPSGDSLGVYLTMFNNTGPTMTLSITDGLNNLYFNGAFPFNFGDVFKIAAIGTSISAYQNGVLITTVPQMIAATGNPLLIVEGASSSSTKLSSFSAGSVASPVSTAYSVPDCRHYATFPNGSSNVNGTLTYTVQTSGNPAVPGTDSRTSKPVDSSTQPQNSRTPGTFGPGE